MQAQIEVKNPKVMAAILMLGAFIGLFGETALNMALTNIMELFSITAATAQWLTTGYLLTLAILVPISALLTDFRKKSPILKECEGRSPMSRWEMNFG